MSMSNIEAMYLYDGYSADRGLAGWYRDLTCGEAKRLSHFTSLYVIDRNGCVRECRMNGRPKTWKRSPGCVLSLKYGLRECFSVGGKDILDDNRISLSDCRVVVAVNRPFDVHTPAGIVSDYVKQSLAGNTPTTAFVEAV